MIIIAVDVEELLASSVLDLTDGGLDGGGLAQCEAAHSVAVTCHREDTHASLPAKDCRHACHHLQLQNLGVKAIKLVCGGDQ